MHLSPRSAILALLFSVDVGTAFSTHSLVTCSTKLSSKSVKSVPTVSHVLTVPVYAYKIKYVTPQTTKTPPPSTLTISDTTTSTIYSTESQITDTYSTTLTSTETDTYTETDSETDTVIVQTVTITSTPTVTVAASAGFTPINSGIQGAAKKRQLKEHMPELDRRTAASLKLGFQNGHVQCEPPVYPQAVTCAGIVEILTTSTITKTLKSTKTYTASTPTSTVQTTITQTTTSTALLMDASTTLTFSTTVTEDTTVTVTTTSTESDTATVSVVQPTATYYAACAPNNILTTVNGGYITSGEINHPLSLVTSGTAYDCCAACITTSNCGSTFFEGAGSCVLILNADTCTQDNLSLQVQADGTSDLGYRVSNGYCGYDSVTTS